MMFSSFAFWLKSVADNMMMERQTIFCADKAWQINGLYDRPVKYCFRRHEDVYHESWSGVAGVYEVFKLKSFLCREHTVAKVIHDVAPLVFTRFGCI